MRLEHINMTVNDVAKSFDFYRELFGFKCLWKGSKAGETGKQLDAMHMGTHNVYIALFEVEDKSFATSHSAPSDYSAPGINHMGFVVDDLEYYRTKLKAMNIEPHLEADYAPGKRFYFFDMDGIEIELVEYASA